MKSNGRIIMPLTALCVVMLSPITAHAYLDPGTGSMMVQALLAAVAAVGVSIGIFWRRFRSFFGRIFGRKNSGRHDSDDT